VGSVTHGIRWFSIINALLRSHVAGSKPAVGRKPHRHQTTEDRPVNAMSTLAFSPDQLAKISLPGLRQAIRRAALALAAALGVAGAAAFGHYYLTTGRYLETTDDAYVKADSTIIAPKVSGYIAEVLVSDNEPVRAGQLLARIDDRDFRTALNQARADVAAAEAAVKNLSAQIELQEPLIQQQAAEVDATEANLQFAHEERARYDDLMRKGAGTVQ